MRTGIEGQRYAADVEILQGSKRLDPIVELVRDVPVPQKVVLTVAFARRYTGPRR